MGRQEVPEHDACDNIEGLYGGGGDVAIIGCMQSILKYKSLIREIPVECQSAHVKKDVWARIQYKGKREIEKSLFGSESEIEICRKNILFEQDFSKKIVMALMWGYPTGGRGNNIQNILKDASLKGMLSSVHKKNLTQEKAEELLKGFAKIKGLGLSTWSKLLYFFQVSIESMKCQIFDIKIVDSLNHVQFEELEHGTWKHEPKQYFEYIKLLRGLAKKIGASPDQVELFLFYYNLGYKF